MIDESVLERVLGAATKGGASFAEVFAEDKRSSSAVLDDGKVEELTSGRDRGAGIRVVVGESTGFAHTADLSEASLIATAEIAAAAARGSGSGTTVVDLSKTSAPRPNVVQLLPGDVPKARKVELLTRANEVARSQGSAITQVMVRYSDSRRRILVANTDGTFADDDQVKTVFSISCVATGDTGMQTGRESVGHTVGFELFDQVDVEDKGGTMRLGAYTAHLQEGSQVARIYGSTVVSERHRHRYEFNPDYRAKFEGTDFVCSGESPDGRLVEFIELRNHPFWIGTQAHPELKSRPTNPAPLFREFVAAARARAEGRNPHIIELDEANAVV